MKLLVIDCCIRGELSSTKRLLKAFIEKFGGGYEVEYLNLCEQNLRPMDNDELALRNRLVKEGRFDDAMFCYANSFLKADKIVVAAPYWDFSFPALLKVYLEKLAITGLTFGYEGTSSVGYCKAEKAVLLSTAGGFISGPNLGSEYVKAFVNMLGITNFSSFVIEGLDIDPSKREQLLLEGIERITSAAEF